jgi:gamma-glutamyl hercynylcysteine S-oxide synthase
VLDIQAPTVDAARMRRAGRDLLSLALMDARNHTLRWMAAFEQRDAALAVPMSPEFDPPRWEFGHVGWFQEAWIARNVQRGRGERCDPTRTRLASLLPDADRCWDDTVVPPAARWGLVLPDAAAIRQYLVDTLEVTLELLEGCADEDDALYFYRLALFHEDAHVEAFATTAQTLGFHPELSPGLLAGPAALNPRAPLLFPATRFEMGSNGGGFAFDNERPRLVAEVPEFEIDAQPVAWEHFGEFVEDGGYDAPQFWSEAGWHWLQREGRRVPRHVDQLRHGVLQQRFGRLMRVPGSQPAMHLSWHEAQAWCSWAGRRLPTEVEWELAAVQGASRGFRFGDVWEWTATTFRGYPGFVPGPVRDWSQPDFGRTKVLRGGSFATPARLRHARLRRGEAPTRDDLFCGFRSCML